MDMCAANDLNIQGFDAIVAAPGFALGVCCHAHAVTAIRFLEPQPEKTPDATPLAAEAVRQLKAWLLDARFVFDLPTKAEGTRFQARVWAQIRAIPLGQTRTYGQLAQALQSAPRPVGGACGANPLPLIVPCHRVIASDGGLGGFNRARGGFLLETKRWLLNHEAACA
jgi:methylated-DNA-[protein]-cysteine S-methyltransferase